MKLGNLIKLIEIQPKENVVRFDFCGAAPDGIDSSRGSYDELAIGATISLGARITVADLLTMCVKANGSTYSGWKGGEYVMSLDTPVWVDNVGEWTNTKITGVHDLGYGYSIISTTNDEI